MMIKSLLLAAALLSLALATGCAAGGSGPCASNCPSISLTDVSNGVAGANEAPVTVSINFTAVFNHTQSAPVTWSIQPTSCGSACGTITSTGSDTATYTAPNTVPASPNNSITVVATSQSNSNLAGQMALSIVDISTAIQPASLSVGQNLQQQFTAVAIPDNAPQTFIWTCTVTSNQGPCGTFSPAPNTASPGLATYTAADSCAANNCINISAVSAADPNNCSKCPVAKATIVQSRVSGAYGFRFSGYDGSGNPVNIAGTFTANTAGNIISGLEDVLTSTGPLAPSPIPFTGSYQAANPANTSSNSLGTLTFTGAPSPNSFQVVIDSAGDVQMVAFSGSVTGSGVAEPITSNNQFNTAAAAYAFGLTGVDHQGKRIGYVGFLSTTPGSMCASGTTCGSVGSGMMDVNDNGNTSFGSCTSPCTIAGSYSLDTTTGVGQLQLTSPETMNFDFYLANGNQKSASPQTAYLVSKDAPDAGHGLVLGTMVLQNSKTSPYNNAAFNGTSVSALTGANGNVSLTYGGTDGNGNFSGGFDQNISGQPELSVPYSPGFSYTYKADSSNLGRYTFQMLGNPTASPALSPLPFVLYASGANTGFLLDQSSSAVITGAMAAQSGKASFTSAGSTGPFAVATNSNSLPSIMPLTMNLVLTSPGSSVFNVAGELDGAQMINGCNYTLQFTGTGTLSTTTGTAANPCAPTADYVIYGVDATHFYMIEKDAGTSNGSPVQVSSPIFYMEQ